MRFHQPIVGAMTAAALLSLANTSFAQTAAPAPPAAATAMPAAVPAAPPAAPAPHAAAVPPAKSLIAVSDCNPSLNLAQTGGYVGYAPVYYRGYWGDVYGARYYQPAVTTTNPQLAIHYKNISNKTMTEIQFGLVANGVLRAEVRDVGRFSPHAEIKHRFAISPNVFPIQTGLPLCVPLHITFEDGTKWRNPHLPPPNQHIYYNP